MTKSLLNIGTVERDTGITRDTLRIWERRYGFPIPVRNDKGERTYPEIQVRHLQRIRRLLDQGLRPGKIVGLDIASLDRLEADLYPKTELDESVSCLLDELQHSDGTSLEATFALLYRKQGMHTFLMRTIVPLLHAVGERWATGKLQIFEEHLLSEVLTRFLNSEISSLQKKALKPRVLLATLPGEKHTLGLLMLAAMLSSKKISVINLGGEVPMDQIVAAVERFDADVLGITFSAAYQYESIRLHLNELRESVVEGVDIWLGGEGTRRLRKLPAGVTKFTSLDELSF
jgi:DNA-binding transcriptional MerR regulator